MLRTRIITALVLAALLLPTLFTDSAVPFSVFALVLTAAGAWEWGRLSGLSMNGSLGYAGLLAAGALALLWAGVPEPSALGWAWLAVLWVAACAVMLPMGPLAWRALPLPLRLLMGVGAMFGTWLALSVARSVGVNFMLSVMAIVWASDVSAYFAGHRWGRRKLAPTISPGKTWEGVMGACVGVLVLALIWMVVERLWPLGSASLFSLALSRFGVLGLLTVVAALVALGVVGDLFESMMKRAVGIKDSSQLLPGHGGVLDRVDALLPVLPAAMAVLALGGR